MKVYKPKTLVAGLLSRYPIYLGFCDQRGPEPVPEGKVTLSLPFRKGRRKLVKGRVVVEPHSCPHLGLSYEYYFEPLNEHQRAKLERLMPQVRS